MNLSHLFPARHIKFAVVSDTHLGSKKERLEELHLAYKLIKKRGIKVVLHPGDITEGYGVYKGQEFEIKVPGQQEQIEYCIKNYPRAEGVETYFICGNHDLRQYERGGVDPGVSIASEREDLKYLGQVNQSVTIHGVKIEMLHPAGSLSSLLSGRAQKDINNRPQADLPDVLIYGHFHTSFQMKYHGVHFLQAPCFKDAGSFEKSLGLTPVIGFYIVEAEIDRGKIDSFKTELITY